jgi:hypothetical protein
MTNRTRVNIVNYARINKAYQQSYIIGFCPLISVQGNFIVDKITFQSRIIDLKQQLVVNDISNEKDYQRLSFFVLLMRKSIVQSMSDLVSLVNKTGSNGNIQIASSNVYDNLNLHIKFNEIAGVNEGSGFKYVSNTVIQNELDSEFVRVLYRSNTHIGNSNCILFNPRKRFKVSSSIGGIEYCLVALIVNKNNILFRDIAISCSMKLTI